MGFFGCYAAPIFNLLIAFSVNVMITFLKRNFYPFTSRFTFDLYTFTNKTKLTIFFIIVLSLLHSLIFSLIFWLSGFKLKKLLIIYLLFMYIFYVVGIFLIEYNG